MRKLWIMLSIAVCAVALGAERPAFQSLRYNEDWSLLQDSSQQGDWLDQSNGNYVSVMASFRF